MIYKISVVVLAVALCIVPVFASGADSVDYEVICEEHNCIKTSSMPNDVVCSHCLWGEPEYVVTPETLRDDLEVVDVTQAIAAPLALQDPVILLTVQTTYGGIIDVFGDNNYKSWRINQMYFSNVNPRSSDYVTSYVPAWSSLRSCYYVGFPTKTERCFFFFSDPRFTYIYDMPLNVTVNMHLRFLNGSSPVTFSQIAHCYSNYVSGSWMPPDAESAADWVQKSQFYLADTGYFEDLLVPQQAEGWSNLWFVSRHVTGSVDNIFPGLVPAGIPRSYSLASGYQPNYNALFYYNFVVDDPYDTLELQTVNWFSGVYDVYNGQFPDGYSNGGSIPGYEQYWMNDEFKGGVNPELSGTANSVDGNIDTLQGFETQVHADLDRYLNESGISNYTIPSSLGSAFTWVSDKFTSFINVNGELKTIVLFPAYLGILVAMVHGLEFAGRTLSHKARKGGGD